jgi:hypothetical protein
VSADLERDLRALGADVDWPPTPDIAAAVERRLTADPTQRPASRRRWIRPRRRVAITLAALVLVPAGAAFGDDVLRWLGLASVEVERAPRLPPDARRPALDELGRAVTLTEAADRAGFTALVPPALGAPGEVRVDGDVITLVYRGGDLLLAERPGALDETLLRKVVGPGTRVRRIREGLFISGREHVYLYTRPDGTIAEDHPRLAGNTLVTQRGDLLLRLDGRDLTLAEARALLRG